MTAAMLRRVFMRHSRAECGRWHVAHRKNRDGTPTHSFPYRVPTPSSRWRRVGSRIGISTPAFPENGVVDQNIVVPVPMPSSLAQCQGGSASQGNGPGNRANLPAHAIAVRLGFRYVVPAFVRAAPVALCRVLPGALRVRPWWSFLAYWQA